MRQELLIPSEVNIFDLVAKSGEPLNNLGDAFGFVYTDDCGNDENIDITEYEFIYSVYSNGCEYLSGGTVSGDMEKGTGDDSNKLWFDILSLDLSRAVYQYSIKITDSNSVIKGNLTVR
jgi:hypothetical protein|tara:strand:+ start:202 stop:558 length:357 start_codon:yes stop_codon:yes gene_type:complete